MRMSRLAVIGIGNPLRGDDGIGPAVIALLRAETSAPVESLCGAASAAVEALRDTASPAFDAPSGIGPAGAELLTLSGEATELAEALAGLDAAVVIECARGGNAAGTIRRFNLPVDRLPPETSTTSSHAGGLALALRLLAALGRMPRRVTVLTVTGSNFATGAPMSAPVVEAAPTLARCAEVEIAHMAELVADA